MITFTVCGVVCRLSLLFPATVIVLLSGDETGITMLCLWASLLHEVGHGLAMWWLHDRPHRITMGLFGVRIERQPTCRLSYRDACLISLAGPIVNLCCCALFACTGQWVASVIHGGLGTFNLLPIRSLDGGEALYAMLCRRVGEVRACTAMHVISVALICPLAALGVGLWMVDGRNFTLLCVCGYLILLLFLQEKH